MWGWSWVCPTWPSEASCPDSRGQVQRRRPGCMGAGCGRAAIATEQASGKKGMLNEAIVWPKWSTLPKEWHIQTVIQAYCCGRTTESRRSTAYPTGSSAHPRETQKHEALTSEHNSSILQVTQRMKTSVGQRTGFWIKYMTDNRGKNF